MLLLKQNTKSLTKLTMAKFAFDFLFHQGEEDKNIVILYRMFRSECWKESPKSDVKDQSECDAKKLAKKVTILIYVKHTTRDNLAILFHFVHSN